MIDPDVHIAELARQLREARHQLGLALAERCPGHHAYVQHRDRKPPWCHACRRTAEGVRV